MCGIAGIWDFYPDTVQAYEIDLLTDALSHRGPDGRGVWRDSEIGISLGHRRLAILDLTSAGTQPMPYAEGRYQIVFNGEIYNFLELKNQLQKKGHKFHSESDTEVILASYVEWGESMQQRFNGMWALAIYDAYAKRLFLSRDRFGVKPLYYYYLQSGSQPGRFIFASEVQAIHKVLGTHHPHNDVVLKEMIIGGSHFFHGTNQTYLKDVFSLPGGYSGTVTTERITISSWYELQKIDVPEKFENQAGTLRELVIDSCRLRLRSDVPVATCLSGGIDSGTITAIINNINFKSDSRYPNYNHLAFTASFPNTPIDERESAESLVASLGAYLDVVDISAPTSDALELSMSKCDGPMPSLAFYPIDKLYQYIRTKGVIVTLDGAGPDEMLGGYRPITEAMNAAIDLRDFAWMKNIYETYASQGESTQFSSRYHARQALKKVVLHRIKNLLYARSENSCVQQLFPSRIPPIDLNPFDRSLFNQFFTNPLPGILNQYDRCSMANGVECREPFLDPRVVEFIFSLPVQSKVGGGYTKYVLREAMMGILPDAIRLKKTKIGFNAPIVDWFRGNLKQWMLDQMSAFEFTSAELFNGKQLRNDFILFLDKREPKWDEAWKFWAPVHYTWWARQLKAQSFKKISV